MVCTEVVVQVITEVNMRKTGNKIAKIEKLVLFLQSNAPLSGLFENIL